MTAPLADLLAELRVDLYESSITDKRFFGAAFTRQDGGLALAMPPEQDSFERDCFARALLGRVLGVELAPLPEWCSMAELTLAN
ncbi:hypothetical protein [Streptomyces xanthochromogenes]|uniref:hypothetical protein n=1 Tax=Streptomyces xanthochromogenes TaxID=67384 RepID=UPI002F3E94F8